MSLHRLRQAAMNHEDLEFRLREQETRNNALVQRENNISIPYKEGRLVSNIVLRILAELLIL
jgi:hypothetical protein